jgi:eukaryotic-like serine/threonine-protein kinase
MIGQTLNQRYKITVAHGVGGMGEVFLAIDEKSGQQVAVKVLARHLTLHEESLERFRREAETLRQLKHPNIVGFVDAFEHERQYVIVMEYVPGGSLHDLIKQGPLAVERARKIALDLCDALIRAHGLNIIHRDIKPENVLIDEDGTPKLADFGVARLSESTRMTRSGTQVGTPYYMAPEAWEGKPLDVQADIWSLGVVLFEMLTGQVPFSGDTPMEVMNKVRTIPVPNIKKLRADVPQGLAAIITRMLMRDKKRRYPTVRHLSADLEVSNDQKVDKQRPGNLPWIIGAAVITLIALFMVQPLIRRFTSLPVATSTSTLSPSTPVPQTLTPLTATLTPTSLPAQPVVPAVGDVTLSARDGMPLHYVPGGSFLMGSVAGDEDENPIHQVTLDPFWIDETEVTNRMYALCVADGNCREPIDKSSFTRATYYEDPQYLDYPVIWVSWDDAIAYCSWAQRKLPSEAEWEFVARWQILANGEGQALTYPWGDIGPNSNLLNFNSDVGDTTQVGQYPNGKSPYGALDMAGNVWEWVGDFYAESYYANSPSSNPPGPDLGETRALRGGSWNNFVEGVRAANRFRFLPNVRDYFIGFRCALPDSSNDLQ